MANIPWKTQEEIEQEKNAPKPQTEMDILRDYVLEVDFRLIMMELGI